MSNGDDGAPNKLGANHPLDVLVSLNVNRCRCFIHCNHFGTTQDGTCHAHKLTLSNTQVLTVFSNNTIKLTIHGFDNRTKM